MQTKAKSNSIITHEVLENGVIRFNITGAGSVEFDPAKVHQANRDRAEVHGFIQRISDAAAISRDPQTGLPASASDKLAAMRELVEHYHTGTPEWSRRGAGAGSSGSLLARVLKEIFPAKSAEQIREFIKGKSAQQRAALLASDRAQPIVDRIRKEATKGIDEATLFEGL